MAITVSVSGSDIVVSVVLSGGKTQLQSEFDAYKTQQSLASAQTWLVKQAVSIAHDEITSSFKDNDKTDTTLTSEQTAIDDIKLNRVVAPDISTP